MLRSLFLTGAYLSFFVFGASAPFVLTLGYVWVDGADPQFLSYGTGLLPKLPISLIIGAAAFGSYLMMDRRDGPRFNPATGLVLLFALWVTITTFVIAEVPSAAFDKWNEAVKTLLFSAFLPYAIRSRVQIESFLQILLFSTAIFFMPVGIKTFLSGGGYGVTLSMVPFNSGLGEGATLATIALMMIPIALFLAQHSLLLAFTNWRKVGYVGLCIIAVFASVGTYERTALVGFGVVGVMLVLKSRHKILVGASVGIAALGIIYLTSSGWNERIATVADYSSDGSALGRVLVWRWTLQYVAGHPLGGGFNVYLIDHIVFPDGYEVWGKAFHSIYFEVLGEQGYVGFAIFAALLIYTFFSLRRIIRVTKAHAEMLWARDLAGALQTALLTLMACGAFIGIAFQPFIYYVVAITVSLRHNVGRSLPAADPVRQSWRPKSIGPVSQPAVAAAITAGSGPASWRQRIGSAPSEG
jgi:putative inorganic carbon (HCO3(-)) transporter